MSRFCIAALVAVLSLTNAALGQTFDVNGPNAILTLQQQVPSVVDPTGHDIGVSVPGFLEISVVTGANPSVPIILGISPVDPTTGSTLVVPWGGSVDIGTAGLPTPSNIFIVGNGMVPQNPVDAFFFSSPGNPGQMIAPEFLLSFPVGIGLDGTRNALQAIVADPTLPPFNLDNTEAGDANFTVGQTLLLNPTSSTPPNVQFLAGKVFNFHGVAHSDIYINSNGFINFNNGTSVPSSGFTIDAVGWANAEPSIAPILADWDDVTAPDAVLYEEIGNSVRIAWGDPVAHPAGIPHFNRSDSNNFEVTLQLQDPNFTNPADGQFTVSLFNLDPNTTSQNGDGVIGHTPGSGFIVGGAADVDLHTARTDPAGFAQIEEHNATGGNMSVLGYDGMGTPRSYNNIHSWNGQSITFSPNSQSAIAGDLGYISQPSAQAADDVRGIEPAGLNIAGGQLATVIGKFFGFNDSTGAGGSIVFDPNGAAMAATVIGVFDSTGTLQPNMPNMPNMSSVRDGEGILIATPSFPNTGTFDMQVNFNSGASFTVPVSVVNPGQTLTTYTGLEGGGTNFATHTLASNTISLYGQTYSQFFISQHGYITFGLGTARFSENLPDFFDGLQVAGMTNMPNPGVAAFWSDLNSNLAATSPSVDVIEDLGTGETIVCFRDQNWWQTQNSAGDIVVRFNSPGPGSVTFDHSNFLADPAAGNTHDVIIGITNGDDTVGTMTDLSDGTGTGISSMLGVYTSPGNDDSFAELVPVGVQPGGTMTPLGSWTASELGSGFWTLF